MKRALGTMITLIFAVLLAACSNTVATGYAQEPGNETPQAETWQEAYTTLLKWYMAYAPPIEDGLIHRSFILHDVDLDGIPELIVTYIAAGIWVESISTFRDGRLTPIEGSFFAYFGVYSPLNNQSGIVIQAYGNVCLMVIDGYSLTCDICLRRPFLPQDLYEATWYINGEIVTEEEHDKLLNTLIAYDWDGQMQHRLWPYDLTEDNIHNVIQNWEPRF